MSRESLRSLPSSTVFLNVYDIVPYNDILVPWGIGVHHSAIEVHGMEIAFGRCPRGSGVFECQPKRCPGHKFRLQLVLGTTPYSQGDVEAWLESMLRVPDEAIMLQGGDAEHSARGEEQNDEDSTRYSPTERPGPSPPYSKERSSSSCDDDVDRPEYWAGPRYHLLRNNCNHFSSFLAAKLLPLLPTPPFDGDVGQHEGVWFRGIPSNVPRYETGEKERAVRCSLPRAPTGRLSGAAPPLTSPPAPCGRHPTSAAASSTSTDVVVVDALVPAWVNRLSVLGNTLLPHDWVEKLESLDRQAQGM